MIFQSRSASETEAFAQSLSLWLRPGMVILLKGELGAGKSTFARALIRALAPHSEFDVPSPTFSLVQTYDTTRVAVAHADLFRLGQAADFHELGLQDLTATHAVLIEWPNEEANSLSQHTLILEFSGIGQHREITVSPTGNWAAALKRNAQIEEFLSRSGYAGWTREFLDGDASARRYEKIIGAGESMILMDMPKRPDGPPVKDGKPYSAIAHLAEGLVPVVAINDQLCSKGYSAPKIHHADFQKGLALIEDLGPGVFGRMLTSGGDMEVPLQAAVELLADMAGQSWPEETPVRAGPNYTLPRYDEAAQLIEVDLLPAWFHMHVRGVVAAPALHESFAAEWRKVLPLTQPAQPVWVMRDYHSPNLIWLPTREGVKRVGIIDTQDALLGHPAYDLASMLQDARVDIGAPLADTLFEHYLTLRRNSPGFDEEEFKQAFAILGAQRATKILGIFARLNARDGKPAYLKHMPRVSRYLAANLEHPVLRDLRSWYQEHLPEALVVGVEV